MQTICIIDIINTRKIINIKTIIYTTKLKREVELMAEMTEAAREARNAYRRKWYSRNRDKQREYNKTYWEKKAAAQATQEEKTETESE